ncbi:alpha/beta fold hydrolase [Cereibacter sphaeroides]|uniref:alpha/beta fold hydrolase n=1 Tax=Cereibacter sphaeroides TaxID=1063 RepID=UPI003FCCC766
MSDILLVHGSGYGGWCWHATIRALAAHGARARALDLPGRIFTPSLSLADHAAAILQEIRAPVTLVGHSAGGFSIAAAAEAAAPGLIERLIFLCAYAPRDGASVASMRRAQARQPLRPAIRLAPDRLSYSFDPDLAGEALFHDCPPEVRAAALARMGAEPVGPQEERIRLSARYHAVPKHYIRCLEDRAIPPETQEAMTADWPAGSVSTLPAGHSPFLSCPEALAKRLISVAANPLSCRPTPG